MDLRPPHGAHIIFTPPHHRQDIHTTSHQFWLLAKCTEVIIPPPSSGQFILMQPLAMAYSHWSHAQIIFTPPHHRQDIHTTSHQFCLLAKSTEVVIPPPVIACPRCPFPSQ
eukprot:TRINITY_DN2948_c0_g1_i5.p1 TRINITY_DN2948_c0_g1~~TRINITY_DN2948_c0_g1_i5.p1  ORF type:complete len:111 (-),score=3.25 TRINITY_DN2948_c0_g1_i5:31-363(-)